MNTLPKIATFSLLMALSAGMMGCSSTPTLSDSLYRTSEVGISKITKRCRVLAVREVRLRDGGQEAKDDGFLAGIGGAILGATLGSEVGGGTGRLIASEVGAMAGAVGGSMAGTAISDKLSERAALEYSVILDSGEERTLVQEFLETDRVVNVGETCRLQVAADGRNRVLPAEHLPGQILAPKSTQIIR